jgi:phosphoribosylamine--glycine ligase
MKILVIGSGGREHTLVWKIAQSKLCEKIFCAPGNGGIADIAECVQINADDIAGLLDFVKKEKIDFTIVGPEAPLAAGIVDEFRERKLKIFGPQKKAARLEASKIFAKELMAKYGVPTADFKIFSDPQEAYRYLDEVGAP